MFAVFKDKAFIKKFFTIAFPVMLQTLIGLLVNFADNLMIGAVSNEAVSAVYAVNQGTFFYIVVGFGILAGSGILVQQFFGAKDVARLRQTFRYKLLAGTAILVVFAPLYYFFGHYLIAFYSRSDANQAGIMAEAMRYLPIILISYIPTIYTTAYATTYREIGKTAVPMIAGLVALVINVTFNAIFIYGMGMGVVGAAIATMIARFVEFIVIWSYGKTKHIPFTEGIFDHFHIEKKVARLITRKSVPLFLNEVLWAGGMLMLSLAYSQRANVLSALSIVYTMTDIFGIVFQGLSVGIGVMVGNLLGAGKLEEAKDNNKKLLIFGVFISLIAALIMAASAFVAPYMFVEVTAEQKHLATQLLLVYASFVWAFSICICSYMTLRAGGKTVLTFLFDSATMWTLVVPTAWILASLTNLNIVTLYIVVQCFDVLKAGVGIWLVSRGTWAVNLTHGISDEVAAIEGR